MEEPIEINLVETNVKYYGAVVEEFCDKAFPKPVIEKYQDVHRRINGREAISIKLYTFWRNREYVKVKEHWRRFCANFLYCIKSRFPLSPPALGGVPDPFLRSSHGKP